MISKPTDWILRVNYNPDKNHKTASGKIGPALIHPNSQEKTIMRKFIGIALIIAAVFGLILSIGGIAGIWIIKDRLAANVKNTIGMISTTIEATGSALVVADKALGNAVTSVSALENTVQTLGVTVSDTTPLLDSISKIMTEDFPSTMQATQVALSSAQNSARSIESTLRLLTAIPILPIEPYQPTVPLTDALGNLNESLNPLTESFSSMDKLLASSRGNLTMLAAQVNIISRRVGEIKTSLSEAQQVISQYQNVTSTFAAQMESVQQSIDNWIVMLTWVLTIIFIWLALTQVGLLMQGWEMVTAEGKGEVEVVEMSEPEPVKVDNPSED
jgi:hypothetical protein